MIDSSPHVLVVDDDQRLRELLQRYLRKCGYRVSTACDAAEARGKLAGLVFDLVVLDVMMPGESGLELTRSLRHQGNIPVLLLTAMGESSQRIAGLEHGADDYLTKPFEPRELVLRIEAILRRGGASREAPRLVRLGAYSFDVERGELRNGEELVHLTSMEGELLRLFARNPGSTIPRDELLRHSGAGNVRAVDVQITRLRRKIEADPKAPRYLHTVWGQGYVLWPD